MIDFRPLSDDHPDLAYSPLLNVINVEADHGTTERALFAAFFGEEHDWDNAGWREMAAFSSCVLRPLEWAGLLVQTHEERGAKHVHHVFKTPLWRSTLMLHTDTTCCGRFPSSMERWPTHESARAYMAEHWQEPWGDRRQELVFIGAGIDWPALKASLDSCLVPEHLAPDPESLPDLPDPFPLWRRAEEAA